MKLTLEQFTKRTKNIEDKKEWITKDYSENQKKYNKQDFINSCEKNINIFFGLGLPYELILEIFSYCDINTYTQFGVWKEATTLASKTDYINSGMSQLKTHTIETVKFIFYFDICKMYFNPEKHNLECCKFLYYNSDIFNVWSSLGSLAFYPSLETLEFLLDRNTCLTNTLRSLFKKQIHKCVDSYKWIYDHPNEWDLQLACQATKKNGCPCLNSAVDYGYCGIHTDWSTHKLE